MPTVTLTLLVFPLGADPDELLGLTGAFTVTPPERGEITVGRAEECVVCLPDAKVSRVHAVIRPGEPATVVDLGSRNGTLVADRRVKRDEPEILRIGDPVTVGSAVILLQADPGSPASIRVCSQTDFEKLVEQEYFRIGPTGSSFAMLSVHVHSAAPDPAHSASSPGSDRARRLVQAARTHELISRTLGQREGVATFAGGTFRILLPRTTQAAAQGRAEELRARLREAGFEAEVGVASYGRDRSPSEATEEASPAPPTPQAGSAMSRLEPVIAKVAPGTINVLILGETGVGKEVLARALHDRSLRRDRTLLALNCAALSESLLESELFGYERGAFTGAVQAKPGLLESAEGGTVFLDEVGEIPLALQAKLLRVLEQREVQRIGSLKPRSIDVRFIAATHRDLEAEVAAGRFREDLYYRLNGITLTVPPLRERVQEIEDLSRAFVRQACVHSGRASVPIVGPEVMALLKRYPWPGNIRELRNVMERAVILCAGGVIGVEHLPPERFRAAATAPAAAPRDSAEPAATLTDDEALERQRIVATLADCGGNQTKAAKLLGMSRRTLVSRLGQYGLPRPKK